jgi:hypothetical protein
MKKFRLLLEEEQNCRSEKRVAEVSLSIVLHVLG